MIITRRVYLLGGIGLFIFGMIPMTDGITAVNEKKIQFSRGAAENRAILVGIGIAMLRDWFLPLLSGYNNEHPVIQYVTPFQHHNGEILIF
jgi:xanthine/uracil permease